MTALGSRERRKRRYEPEPDRARPVTPHALHTLEWIGRLELVTAGLLASVEDRSEQAVRRDLRVLVDNLLIRVVVVPRAFMVAEPNIPLRSAFGSFPNLYQLLGKGVRLLRSCGRMSPDDVPTPYLPTSAMFLKHELATRTTVATFIRAAAINGHQMEHVRFGTRAIIDLGRSDYPKKICPDAIFSYRFADRVLCACLEYDTGSEKGTRHWDRKLSGYTTALQPERFEQVMGHAYGRVVVVCYSSKRRDQLTALISERAKPALAERFWLAASADLAEPNLSRAVWRKPGISEFVPLIPTELYHPAVAK